MFKIKQYLKIGFIFGLGFAAADVVVDLVRLVVPPLLVALTSLLAIIMRATNTGI